MPRRLWVLPIASLALAVMCFIFAEERAAARRLTLVYNVNNGGYIDVCGCTHKEVRQGSLTRRASFLKQLRATGRQILLVDGGSSLFPIEDRVKDEELPEAMRKARLIVEAYNRMGYQALAVGSFDLAAGIDKLEMLAKEAKFPFLSANLLRGSTGTPYFTPHVVIEVGGSKVGLIGLTLNTMGKGYISKVAPDAVLEDPVEAARKSLDALRGKVDLVLALSHLREEANAELISKLGELEILVDPFIQYGNHHTWIKEGEWVGYRGDTLFLRGDGQGARLGVVDIEVTTPRAKLMHKTRLEELTELEAAGKISAGEREELRTFAGKNLFAYLVISLEPHHGKDPEMDALIAKSATGGNPAGVPALTDPLPRKKDFLTTEGCKGCHEKQYIAWTRTKHAEAMTTLAQDGSDMHFDCVGCHSLGYGAAFLDLAEMGPYANVQCESCHGTLSEHATDPKAHPFPKVKREDCLGCHNKEFTKNEFDFLGSKPKVQCPKG